MQSQRTILEAAMAAELRLPPVRAVLALGQALEWDQDMAAMAKMTAVDWAAAQA
jgi:hypothetical protein